MAVSTLALLGSGQHYGNCRITHAEERSTDDAIVRARCLLVRSKMLPKKASIVAVRGTLVDTITTGSHRGSMHAVPRLIACGIGRGLKPGHKYCLTLTRDPRGTFRIFGGRVLNKNTKLHVFDRSDSFVACWVPKSWRRHPRGFNVTITVTDPVTGEKL